MPAYTFRGPNGQHVSKRLSFTEYESVKSGEKSLVDDDGNVLELVFDPGAVGVVFKDGVSGGWASKALKENRYREERRTEMARREKDHVFKSRLIPNYEGQEAENWGDVRDHVRSTKGVESAKTYDPLVAKEKRIV